MADSWAWVVFGAGGIPISMDRARGRRLSFARNRAAQAQLTLGLYDQAAIDLFASVGMSNVLLAVYRNDVVVFAGHLWPMSGGNAVDSSSFVNLVFKDAFALYDFRLTPESVSYVAEDAAIIATTIIENSDEFYATGSYLTIQTIEATKTRDRTYNNKVISEAVIELTEVQGGFDFYAAYLNPPTNGWHTMHLNFVAHYGSDREAAIFEFGPGTLSNCKDYKFTTTLPVNNVRAIGAGGLTSEQWNEDSSDRFTFYQIAVSATDVSEATTLADKALDAIRTDPAMVTEFTGDPARCPQPWDDFWLGDTVRFNADDGAVQVSGSAPRVQTIDVGLDEEDNVADLVVGIDPAASGAYLSPLTSARRYVQQQRDVLRRLSALER